MAQTDHEPPRYSANHRWSGGGSPHLFLMPQPASVSRCRAGLTRTTSSRGEGGGRCIAKFIYLKGGNVTLVGSGFEPWELKFWECTAPKRGICCSPRNSRIRHHPSCNHRVIFSWTREAIRAYHQCGLSSNLVASRTAPHPPNPLPGYTLRRVNIEKYRVGRSSQPSKRKIDSYFITTNTVCGGHPMQPIGQHRLAVGLRHRLPQPSNRGWAAPHRRPARRPLLPMSAAWPRLSSVRGNAPTAVGSSARTAWRRRGWVGLALVSPGMDGSPEGGGRS